MIINGGFSSKMTKQEIINAYAHDLAVMAQENKKLSQRVMDLELEKQQLIQEINRLQEESDRHRKEKMQLLREKILRDGN